MCFFQGVFQGFDGGHVYEMQLTYEYSNDDRYSYNVLRIYGLVTERMRATILPLAVILAKGCIVP